MLLAEVVTVLDSLFPPRLAEAWDAVGLVCGDPDEDVRSVLFAIDPVAGVAAEALSLGADLLVTHHPLFLRGTSSVAATLPKGRVVHDLVRGGCALHVAHTNADSADPGVSDALADLFRLRDTVPLQPRALVALDRLDVLVPSAHAAPLRDALAAAGAGRLGAYDGCAFTSTGEGTFRPLPGATPAIGEVGRQEVVDEARVEVVLDRSLRRQVLAAMRSAHPYEEPSYGLVELAGVPGRTGLGRVGDLPAPVRLADLVARAADVLPATGWGVRGSGDPDLVVERLAVCGGAGDSLLAEAAASGAQAFLTSDLRHHAASEAPVGLALVDAAHWATEWPWLPVAARQLADATGLLTRVSRLVTDTFALHRPSRGQEPPA